jgi:hypothetical protein
MSQQYRYIKGMEDIQTPNWMSTAERNDRLRLRFDVVSVVVFEDDEVTSVTGWVLAPKTDPIDKLTDQGKQIAKNDSIITGVIQGYPSLSLLLAKVAKLGGWHRAASTHDLLDKLRPYLNGKDWTTVTQLLAESNQLAADVLNTLTETKPLWERIGTLALRVPSKFIEKEQFWLDIDRKQTNIGLTPNPQVAGVFKVLSLTNQDPISEQIEAQLSSSGYPVGGTMHLNMPRQLQKVLRADDKFGFYLTKIQPNT